MYVAGREQLCSVFHFDKYSNPGLFQTILTLLRSSQLSLAMASFVCAAPKK